MADNRQTILRVEGLKQYFKSGFGKNKIVVKAVDDVSFEIKKGEVFSLVGESGCGKTTTGRTIIKLYKSSGGEVFFHDTRVLSDVKAAKKSYKENVKALKQELELGNLTQEAYNEKLLIEKQTLKKAKRDNNFENIIDEDGKKAIKDIESFQEYQDIIQKYAQRIEDANTRIASLTDVLSSLDNKDSDQKAAFKETQNALKEAKKELALSKLRQKQDIQNLKYQLIHKNKLLMRKMQMIFQDPIASLNPRMTVKEIIAEGLRINGFKNEEVIDQRVKEALETVGLVAEHASRYPHEFSGGQRQRIAIARALLKDAPILILDEATSALDNESEALIQRSLQEHAVGKTTFVIAHRLSTIENADQVLVMDQGRLVAQGSHADLIETNDVYRSLYQQGFSDD